jgi:hypothetical protein
MSNLIQIPGMRLAVRWRTELCDARGRVIRQLQRGRNMVTDWGMDARVPTLPFILTSNLHLGSTTEVLKRVGDGVNELTVDFSGGAGDVDLATVSNFFEAGDVGRTLKIDGWPELLVTAFTDAQHVTCTARGGVWLPGFSPAAGPFTAFGVHYTNVPTLATQFTKFNTYDTAAPNYGASLVDVPNSRFINQRIFLSGVVAGAAWTVNQLGWSDGNASNYCLGKTNLASPDIVPIGNRYRVTLQVFSAYTPINLAAQVIDWGPDIGAYTVDIRQERIANDDDGDNSSGESYYNFLQPYLVISNWNGCGYWTSAFSMTGPAWRGDAGYTNLYSSRTRGASTTSGALSNSAYVAGNHFLDRSARWPDTMNIAAATGLFMGTVTGGANLYPTLTVRPTSGTINKPSGFWASLTFRLHWTRDLPN